MKSTPLRFLSLLGICVLTMGSAMGETQDTELDLSNPYLDHAPLAFFSVGSLAVGGVFYAIQSSLGKPQVGYVAGDRTSLSTAVGAAGLTALIAGASYFYFANRDSHKASSWDAQVSGGVAPDGKMNVCAALVLPLPFGNL
jgi:hypothetical protein